MNERIRKLLNVCGMPNEQLMAIYNDANQTFYMDQFAKLIIKDVLKHVLETTHYRDGNQFYSEDADFLKKHVYGVK